MLSLKENMIEKKQTLIFIFIPKILPKQMQNLVFFLKKNNFSIKRINKKNQKEIFVSFFRNSNFVLENETALDKAQLQLVIDFLNPLSVINGICFQNQILTLDRIAQGQKVAPLGSWKQKFTILL